MDSDRIVELARACGFELAGVAGVEPLGEHAFFAQWVERGMAAGMRYLTDHRAELRRDVRKLLPTAKSVVCVGKLYNAAHPCSGEVDLKGRGWVARYAWGAEDYHEVIRRGLQKLVALLKEEAGQEFQYRIAVDTMPVLERALARRAGLGWIGRNTCLINEPQGSWFFLGELLVSLELEAGAPAPERCGTCMACVEACPTQAIVKMEQDGQEGWVVDATRCIAYYTIEHKGAIPESWRAALGHHVFGCDICQEVCPWNQRAPVTAEPGFQPRQAMPRLAELAALGEDGLRERFRGSALSRAGGRGLLRNTLIAMGNDGSAEHAALLEQAARHGEAEIAGQARWALARLQAGSNKV